ncbi:hypothetical protein H8356DRAFT_1341400 [Neocallimastix lanati (nom. inval.)]|nr:hypothetical protein H8356DRAFT_1341400 [Neocallimastix sp. JGI-2020a]
MKKSFIMFKNQIIHPKTKPINIKEPNFNYVTFMNGFTKKTIVLSDSQFKP